MKTPRLVLLAAALAALNATGHAQSAPKAAGHWEGAIQMPKGDVAVAIDLARNSDGAWIGSLTLPGTTSIDVPLAHISADDTRVRFHAALAGNPSFEAQFNPDADSLAGTAANAQGEALFQLKRNGAANVKLPLPSSRLTKAFAGTWEGTLEVKGKTLHIALKLAALSDGTATATLISVDQGNQEIPVTTVTLQEKQLQLDVRGVSGRYRGTLGGEGEIVGEWAQGGSEVALTFKRVGATEKTPAQRPDAERKEMSRKETAAPRTTLLNWPLFLRLPVVFSVRA